MHISATSMAELTEDELKSAAIQVLSAPTEALKGGTIQKKCEFFEKLSENFFARFHIFNDLFFIQHNFFVSI